MFLPEMFCKRRYKVLLSVKFQVEEKEQVPVGDKFQMQQSSFSFNFMLFFMHSSSTPFPRQAVNSKASGNPSGLKQSLTLLLLAERLYCGFAPEIFMSIYLPLLTIQKIWGFATSLALSILLQILLALVSQIISQGWMDMQIVFRMQVLRPQGLVLSKPPPYF